MIYIYTYAYARIHIYVRKFAHSLKIFINKITIKKQKWNKKMKVIKIYLLVKIIGIIKKFLDYIDLKINETTLQLENLLVIQKSEKKENLELEQTKSMLQARFKLIENENSVKELESSQLFQSK